MASRALLVLDLDNTVFDFVAEVAAHSQSRFQQQSMIAPPFPSTLPSPLCPSARVLFGVLNALAELLTIASKIFNP